MVLMHLPGNVPKCACGFSGSSYAMFRPILLHNLGGGRLRVSLFIRIDARRVAVEPPGGEDNPCASRVNKRTGTSTLARFWYRITRMFHRKRVHENGRPRLDK
ncbi:hypothetical protein AAG570_005408 [Ranatra chinensis]|uniref:Uncharacterized protein n=1 Tax=Ranatra chinensis TaxID=642074 RepID=A0ABD0YM51_9HEMI